MPRPHAKIPKYTLERRGDSYSIRWWDGERSTRVPCRTKDRGEAERFLADFKATIGNTPLPPLMTVGAILDGYVAWRTRRSHSTTLQVSVATLKRHIGALTAELLTNDVTEQYQDDRRKEGPGGASAKYRKTPRPLSDGTLIRELGVLRRALAWATEQNPPWLTRAPHIERPEAPSGRDRYLTRPESTALIAAAETTPHIALFVMIALYTGARTGAILDLTWDRVNFDGGDMNMGEGRGKKRRARKVPINPAVLPYLKVAYATHTTPWVIEFRGQRVSSIKTGFRAAAQRAKLPGITPHVLRHTAITWMVQQGVPFVMISKYSALSMQMIEHQYGHHSSEWMREASKALSEYGMEP
jgi:integrase